MEHKFGFGFKSLSAEVVFAGGFHLKAGVEQENPDPLEKQGCEWGQ